MERKPSEIPERQACEVESEVVRAIARRDFNDDFRGHVESCSNCQEVWSISQQLDLLVQEDAKENLPSARLMWWKLKLRTRREKASQAKLPLVWMGRVYSTTILCIAAFALRRVPILVAVSSVLSIGLLALVAVTLPVAIVLWRWSRS
jgi:hypothetical protein